MESEHAKTARDFEADRLEDSTTSDRNLKLIVQIPCLNEETTLPDVIAAIPRKIPGIRAVEVLVIDDGSIDRTLEVARTAGADHVIGNKVNRGLAASFQSGIERSVELGADIVVNTDGDHQYDGSSIPDLIAPIVAGAADIVIGDRNPGANPEFSAQKRFLQRMGSLTIAAVTGTDVKDAVSGFRAYSREAALSVNVMTKFSYTIETIIHAAQSGFVIRSVPVKVNSATRPSRLFKSTANFLRRQLVTLIRSLFMYRSLRSFILPGLLMIGIGGLPILRFLYFYSIGQGDGHLQSLVIGGVLILAGYFTVVVAFLSDSMATNRRLTEALLVRLRKIEAAGMLSAPPPEALPDQAADSSLLDDASSEERDYELRGKRYG
ncbi:MAG: glycosyltransferase family 2 protein [Pseudomonadota bacterium]